MFVDDLLFVAFSGFAAKVTTKYVWRIFKQEGDILSIELFDDFSGDQSGRGRIRFRYVRLQPTYDCDRGQLHPPSKPFLGPTTRK
jgi:hypothetical protein